MELTCFPSTVVGESSSSVQPVDSPPIAMARSSFPLTVSDCSVDCACKDTPISARIRQMPNRTMRITRLLCRGPRISKGNASGFEDVGGSTLQTSSGGIDQQQMYVPPL